MPRFRHVIWIVQGNGALDDCPGEISDRGIADLPSQHTKPADKVAENPLAASWCKFGNPVVLILDELRFRGSAIIGLTCPPVVGAWDAISAIEMTAV